MIIASRGQLERQEAEGHHPESFDLRARGIGGRLFAPSRGFPLARGDFRARPEPPRRLLEAHLIVRQILLHVTQAGGDGVAQVSENLEEVQTSVSAARDEPGRAGARGVGGMRGLPLHEPRNYIYILELVTVNEL